MKPYPHQVELADKAYGILQQLGWVYIAAEERCGKTLASILLAEKSKAKSILVLTKKKAILGWDDTFSAYGYENMLGQWMKDGKEFKVTNYHQAHKLGNGWDLVILDEAHSYLSAFPKTGKIWKEVYKIVYGKPIVYLSATPFAESLSQIYNQLRLSKWSPFKQRSFYEWHRRYGKPDKVRTPYGLVDTYKKVDREAVLKEIEPGFIYLTRKDLNFQYEPEDNVRYVELHPETVRMLKDLTKTEMFIFQGTEMPLDTPMKERTVAYQVEGGFVLVGGKCVKLRHQEKVDYIKANYNPDKIAIMAHFKCEQEYLSRIFPNTPILSSTAHSEGVDLSYVDKLIIYSMSFSAVQYIQRRARQANKNRDKPIIVDYLLVKGGISEAVYEAVAKKRVNFTKDSYDRWKEQL